MADVWLASTDASSTAVSQLSQALSEYTSSSLQSAGLVSVSKGISELNPSAGTEGTGVGLVGGNLSVLSNILSQYNPNGQLINGAIQTLQATNVATNAPSGVGSMLGLNNSVINSANVTTPTPTVLAKGGSVT